MPNENTAMTDADWRKRFDGELSEVKSDLSNLSGEVGELRGQSVNLQKGIERIEDALKIKARSESETRRGQWPVILSAVAVTVVITAAVLAPIYTTQERDSMERNRLAELQLEDERFKAAAEVRLNYIEGKQGE